MAEETEAAKAKRLGNEFFASKKYEEAIVQYTDAIRLDPECGVYYSNRSACYASLGKWQQAMEDAAMCLSKDPKFLKGYYRLASAQLELGLLEQADTTINGGLNVDGENEPLLKLKRQLKAKKAAAAKKPARQLDDHQVKELMDLQEQATSYSHDLRAVAARLAGLQREQRATQATVTHLESVEASVPLYRSVGKAFISTPRRDIDRRLEIEQETNVKNQRDLMDRKEYLERRLTSTQQNLKDLTVGL